MSINSDGTRANLKELRVFQRDVVAGQYIHTPSSMASLSATFATEPQPESRKSSKEPSFLYPLASLATSGGGGRRAGSKTQGLVYKDFLSVLPLKG